MADSFVACADYFRAITTLLKSCLISSNELLKWLGLRRSGRAAAWGPAGMPAGEDGRFAGATVFPRFGLPAVLPG